MLREQLLRDEFAKAALTGLASSLRPGTGFNIDIIARQAYELADAMVRQSKVPHKTMEEIAAEYTAFKGSTRFRDNCAPSNNPEIACPTEMFAQCQYMIEWLKSQVLERDAEIARLQAELATGTVQTESDYQAEIDRLRFTDEEREAMEYFASFQWTMVKPYAATLRGLLERLGGER